MILDDLEDTGPLPLPGFRLRMLAAELRQPQSGAHLVLHRIGKAQEVPLRRAHPVERPLPLRQLPSHAGVSQIWDWLSTVPTGERPERNAAAASAVDLSEVRANLVEVGTPTGTAGSRSASRLRRSAERTRRQPEGVRALAFGAPQRKVEDRNPPPQQVGSGEAHRRRSATDADIRPRRSRSRARR